MVADADSLRTRAVREGGTRDLDDPHSFEKGMAMSMNQWCSRYSAFVLVLALAPAASAEIVFDGILLTDPTGGWASSHDRLETSSEQENLGGFENISQTGQRLDLAGTARRVTQLQARLLSFGGFDNHPLSYDQVFRIYSSDSAGFPADLLWTGTASGVSFPPPSVGGFHMRWTTVTVPLDLIVPDRIILTVAEANIVYSASPDEPTGFGISWRVNPPASIGVGGRFLERDTDTGEWSYSSFTRDVTCEFRLTAIPSGSAGVAVGLGAAIGLSRRRRHR